MIYLVRHGEAAASWGEHADPGLSDKGHTQAETVAGKLLSLGAEAFVASPMQRCRETAHPFAARTGQEMRLEPAVSEIVTPEGIGDRVAWLRNLMTGRWPKEMVAWRERGFAAVNALPDQTVVFSHFVAINAIVGRLQDTPNVLVFKPDHCSITQLARDPSGALRIVELGGDATTQIL